MLNIIPISMIHFAGWWQDWDLLLDVNLLSNDSLLIFFNIGILFWSKRFNIATHITHPNWHCGEAIQLTVWGIVVLRVLEMLHIVAGSHEIDSLLEVDRESYIMCCYRWLQFYFLAVCGKQEELERRINISQLYEYVKSFIKTLPGVKSHKKAM